MGDREWATVKKNQQKSKMLQEVGSIYFFSETLA
jgi:hypothetical protein